MIDTQRAEPDDRALMELPGAWREVVLAVVGGLHEEAYQQSVVRRAGGRPPVAAGIRFFQAR